MSLDFLNAHYSNSLIRLDQRPIADVAATAEHPLL